MNNSLFIRLWNKIPQGNIEPSRRCPVLTTDRRNFFCSRYRRSVRPKPTPRLFLVQQKGYLVHGSLAVLNFEVIYRCRTRSTRRTSPNRINLSSTKYKTGCCPLEALAVNKSRTHLGAQAITDAGNKTQILPVQPPITTPRLISPSSAQVITTVSWTPTKRPL